MELNEDALSGHLGEVISHLMAASQAAKRAPNQDLLIRLIDAVLLHAGRELARASAAPGSASPDNP